ncbi:MAG: transcription-repair coupling factor [Proteobacteria bacterium]|nr:transcription-repair coupling factor [Pseudomonadota bacterium]
MTMAAQLKHQSRHMMGVDDPALGYFATRSAQKSAHPTVLVARNHNHAVQLLDEAAFWAPKLDVLFFPAWDVQPYDRLSADGDIQAARLHTLAALKGGLKQALIVTTVGAMSTRVPPAGHNAIQTLHLKKGEQYGRDKLVTLLDHLAYRRVSTVMEAGEFAVRGSLLDVFVPGQEAPVRIDFFDDEIDSIKVFDALTQRSEEDLKAFTIAPLSEVVLNEGSIAAFRKGYRARFPEGADDALYRDISNGMSNTLMGHYLPLFYEAELSSLFDYLPAGATLIAESNFEAAVAARNDQIREGYTARLKPADTAWEKEEGEVYRPLPPELLYLSEADWQAAQESHDWVYLDAFDSDTAEHLALTSHFPYRTTYKTQAAIMEAVITDLDAALKNDQRVLLSVLTPSAAERMKHILAEHDFHRAVVVDDWHKVKDRASAHIAVTPLGFGFTAQTDGLFVLTEQDIFGEKQNPRPQKRRKKAEELISHFSELEVGSLVVHEEHGIGRFTGLETLTVDKTQQDFVVLEYDGGDKLYVPVVSMDVLSRYAAEDSLQKLDKLGGAGWQARKAKVKKNLLEMAAGLLRIAAERQTQKGHRYAKPDGLYDEFVAGFPYVPTPEQQAAIDDVEDDMYGERPMDRLVVGDVGFGKTEVALRAAFVAAADGRQVAVIAPTTLLARQHYAVFQKRFAPFPFKVAMLSSLVKPAEAKRVRDGLAKGEVDIVVGTHALLSKSISFDNLGLVVVDEEQRFGVAHKEKLKQLRATVDILTLTATPIPRTLQMSLAGMRELSTITTPPVDRLAVRTWVMGFDGKVLREAILREIFRGGQVYVVTPRVVGIEKLTRNLQELVPEAKIRVGHGQMPRDELEAVMEDFYDGKFNVLVSTTIIESGIDIPTANTLIVHRADKFGLAQLYQIRGRVGRSKVRAYAYFLLPDGGRVGEDALKRLKILQRLDGIGAGFTLASYDMDMRGPGNLLGKEQSGHIREVGFELYNQMLREAIEQLQAERDGTDYEGDDAFVPVLNLGISYLIPDDYVVDRNLRMSLYRRLSYLREEGELAAFRDELIDRFGPLPKEVETLLAVISIRNRCRKLNIARLDVGEKGSVLTFHNERFAKPEALLHYIFQNTGVVSLRPDQKVVLHRRWADDHARMNGISQFLLTLESL